MSTFTCTPTAPDANAVTPQEAAWITGLSAKAINAAIDRGEVRPVKRSRRRGVKSRKLGTAEVVYLVVRKEAGSTLSPQARRELYEELTELQSGDWKLSSGIAHVPPECDFEVRLAGGVVRVEMRQACTLVAKRWAALREAADVVVEDPDIRGGEPVLRGTRVPVYMVADLISQGADAGEILEDYPTLTATMIEAALAYAQTNPRRGRPAKGPWHRGLNAKQRLRR